MEINHLCVLIFWTTSEWDKYDIHKYKKRQCHNSNCRSRRGRVRTVPSSRANSSKQSRVDPTESGSGGQSKRSRSASEEPWDSSTSTTAAGGVSGQQLEIRGSESQIHREASEPYSSPSHHSNRPRRLTKVGNFCVNPLYVYINDTLQNYHGILVFIKASVTDDTFGIHEVSLWQRCFRGIKGVPEVLMGLLLGNFLKITLSWPWYIYNDY